MERPVPTTRADDGFVHFGDMLTLCSVGVSGSLAPLLLPYLEAQGT